MHEIGGLEKILSTSFEDVHEVSRRLVPRFHFKFFLQLRPIQFTNFNWWGY
jgi:hypothetical protein